MRTTPVGVILVEKVVWVLRLSAAVPGIQSVGPGGQGLITIVLVSALEPADPGMIGICFHTPLVFLNLFSGTGTSL